MSSKTTKREEYLEEVKNASWCAYIKAVDQQNVIGVFADFDRAAKAQKSHALKKLQGRYGYKVQMVIP